MKTVKRSDPLFLGLAYGIGLYAAGFALAIVRNLWLVDTIGEAAAIYLELPVMLGIAWGWCGFLTSRSWLGKSAGPRVVMGLTGFAVLMLLELAGVFAMTGSLTAYLANLGATERLVALAAQMFVAAFPWLRR